MTRDFLLQVASGTTVVVISGFSVWLWKVYRKFSSIADTLASILAEFQRINTAIASHEIRISKVERRFPIEHDE